MSHRTRFALLAGTTLLASTALTGCAIGLSPSSEPTEPDVSTSAPEAPASPVATPADDEPGTGQTPPAPTASGEPTEVEVGDTFTGSTEGEYIVGSCGDDPTAPTDIVITASGGSYIFDGTCGDITIQGDGVYLSAGSSNAVTVEGSDSSVVLESIDVSLSVSGSDNYIAWTAGIGAAQAANSGSGNVLVGA